MRERVARLSGADDRAQLIHLIPASSHGGSPPDVTFLVKDNRHVAETVLVRPSGTSQVTSL